MQQLHRRDEPPESILAFLLPCGLRTLLGIHEATAQTEIRRQWAVNLVAQKTGFEVTRMETQNSVIRDAYDFVCEDGIRRKVKGTPGLALPRCSRADNTRPDVLFWQELAAKHKVFEVFLGDARSDNSTIGGINRICELTTPLSLHSAFRFSGRGGWTAPNLLI